MTVPSGRDPCGSSNLCSCECSSTSHISQRTTETALSRSFSFKVTLLRYVHNDVTSSLYGPPAANAWCHEPTASRRSGNWERRCDVNTGRLGRGGRERRFSTGAGAEEAVCPWPEDGGLCTGAMGGGRCSMRVRFCSSSTSCRMSSGKAARNSAEGSIDSSTLGDACLDKVSSSIFADTAAGRGRTRLD